MLKENARKDVGCEDSSGACSDWGSRGCNLHAKIAPTDTRNIIWDLRPDDNTGKS